MKTLELGCNKLTIEVTPDEIQKLHELCEMALYPTQYDLPCSVMEKYEQIHEDIYDIRELIKVKKRRQGE